MVEVALVSEGEEPGKEDGEEEGAGRRGGGHAPPQLCKQAR